MLTCKMATSGHSCHKILFLRGNDRRTICLTTLIVFVFIYIFMFGMTKYGKSWMNHTNHIKLDQSGKSRDVNNSQLLSDYPRATRQRAIVSETVTDSHLSMLTKKIDLQSGNDHPVIYTSSDVQDRIKTSNDPQVTSQFPDVPHEANKILDMQGHTVITPSAVNENKLTVSASAMSVHRRNGIYGNRNAPYGERADSLLCVVMTIPKNRDTRERAVRRTWAPRCDRTVFSTTEPTTRSSDTIYVKIKDAVKTTIVFRIFRTLSFLYYNIRERYDWIYLTDDDTYVIVENLRQFLSKKNAKLPQYHGFGYYPTDLKHKNISLVFVHGGSGILLSRPALERIAVEGYVDDEHGKCHPLVMDHQHDEHGDVNIGFCLLKLGIVIGESKDTAGRERFLKENPFHILNMREDKKTEELAWFGFRDVVRSKKTRFEALSPETIAFHYMTPGDMYLIDFLLYNLARGREPPKEKSLLPVSPGTDSPAN